MKRAWDLGAATVMGLETGDNEWCLELLMLTVALHNGCFKIAIGGRIFSVMVGTDGDFSINLWRLPNSETEFAWSTPLHTTLIILGWILIGSLDWRLMLLGTFLWWVIDLTVEPRKELGDEP
jgi:hypothetical protein